MHMTDMKRESGVVARMWKWLTEPSPRLTDIELRERVRPFGGRIEIESVPNGGTTVRVYVPAE